MPVRRLGVDEHRFRGHAVRQAGRRADGEDRPVVDRVHRPGHRLLCSTSSTAAAAPRCAGGCANDPQAWRDRVERGGDRHEQRVPRRGPRRAARRGDRGRPLACGHPGQPDGHPGPAAPLLGPARPPRPGHRPGVEVPQAAHRQAAPTCRSAQRARLDQILAADLELAVVWAVKEIVVQLLATTTDEAFDAEWARLVTAVRATDLPEPKSLFRTLTAWTSRDPRVLPDPRHQRPHRGREPRREEHQDAPAADSPTTATTAPVSCSPRPSRARREHPDHGQVRGAHKRGISAHCCLVDSRWNHLRYSGTNHSPPASRTPAGHSPPSAEARVAPAKPQSTGVAGGLIGS